MEIDIQSFSLSHVALVLFLRCSLHFVEFCGQTRARALSALQIRSAHAHTRSSE
jgi:hypothetical protein